MGDKAEKKINAEERISSIINEKYNKIKNFNSRIYYLCIMFLNIIMLILTMIYLNNREDIEDFSIVWENVTVKAILLLFLIFIGIMLLKSLPNFLKLYSKTKSRKFGLVYKSVAVAEYYSIVTSYSSGENAMMSRYLIDNKVNEKYSIDIAYSRSIFNKIAMLIYSTVIMILGTMFWMKNVNAFLYALSFVTIIINLTIVSVVISFNVNKKSTINFISWLSRLLYKLNIVKDYEKFYINIIDKLIIYNKAFKQNKILIFTEIISYILVYFLKGVLLYYSLISLNIGGVEILGGIIFRFVILDLILNLWPLQKGSLIFEAIFIILFELVFFSGYLYWGLVILRIFEYFIYLLQYAIVVSIDGIKNKCCK